MAASELQKIVKDMAAQAKTEVRSERILPPADRGELLEIPVEIAVSCEIRQLVDLLARLDSAPKLLPVQDVKIRVVNLTQPKDLLVTLTVSGFVLPNPQGKAKTLNAERLLAVNVVLAGAALICVALIVKQLVGSRPVSRAPRAGRPPWRRAGARGRHASPRRRPTT